MLLKINLNVRYDNLLESDKYPLKSILNIDRHIVQDDFGDNVRILHSNRLISIESEGVLYCCVVEKNGASDDLKTTVVDNVINFEIDTDALKERKIENVGKRIRRRFP